MSRNRRPKKDLQRYWVGYCRKSTETEDRQVHSLGDQADMIRAHYDALPADETRGRPLKLLEEARSAYHPGRPVFGELLAMAKRGEVHGVIVVHPNRVSRNPSDAGAFTQCLVDGSIGCLDTTTGKRYTPADSSDIFMLTLEGAMSWKDSRDKGDRVLGSMRNRIREGHYQSLPPTGYRIVYDPGGGKSLQPDPDKASIMQALFRLAAEGSRSLGQLTVEAERLGLVTRTGKRVSRSWLLALLTNPFYYGRVRFSGVEAAGRHEPLVPEALWRRAGAALSGLTRAPLARIPEARDDFVFRGLLRCPHCPRRLSPYRARGKYVYYECKNPATRCRVCVPQASLLDQLKETLARLSLPDTDMEKLRQALLRVQREDAAGGDALRQAWRSELDRLQREMAGLIAGRDEAARLGVAEAAEARLQASKVRADELRQMLADKPDDGGKWTADALGGIELVGGLTQAILFGTPKPRAIALSALSSNYSVRGRELLLDLRPPFRLVADLADCSEWCADRYKARTGRGKKRYAEFRDLLRKVREEARATAELAARAVAEYRGEKKETRPSSRTQSPARKGCRKPITG